MYDVADINKIESIIKNKKPGKGLVMAEKELRRMSRPELIEIIYALKSNEESLQKKNAIVRFRFQRQALLQRLPFS